MPDDETAPVSFVRLHRVHSPVRVLGPFERACIWVQGCRRRCRGCLTPESRALKAGEAVSVERLARWVLSQRNIEGITVSGGEPMLQAWQIAELIQRVRRERDLGVVCYTGYELEHLLKESKADVAALLECIDLLIDGPYREALAEDLLWRGSSNQRLLCLTDRYRDLVSGLTPETDRGAGLEAVACNGVIFVTGVPTPSTGFRGLAEQLPSGVTLGGAALRKRRLL